MISTSLPSTSAVPPEKDELLPLESMIVIEALLLLAWAFANSESGKLGGLVGGEFSINVLGVPSPSLP